MPQLLVVMVPSGLLPLQIGELVDTAQRVYDPTETRLLITHASPGREGIIASLALVLKADLYHFGWPSFPLVPPHGTEFSIQGDYDGFRKQVTVQWKG